MSELAIVSFFGGLGSTSAIVAIVFATGSTFGQRCERLFPGDAWAIERCVDGLSSGSWRQAAEDEAG